MDCNLSNNNFSIRLVFFMGGVKMNKYEIEVKEKGKLPHCSDPGAYPIYYVSKSSEISCYDCASEQPEWIEIHDIHWEGPPMICEGCNKEIESAYGDPDEEL